MSRDTDDPPDTKPKAKPNPYREMIANPAARTYLMIAGGGLLVTILTMFLIGSPIAAALLLVVGACGLVLRWTAMPPIFVLLVSYLSFAPLGIPFEFSPFSDIPGSHFRFLDGVLIGSALVYLIGQYRFYSIVHVGMPFDANKFFVKPGAKPTVRPAEAPKDRELWLLFARVGLFVLAGQLLWIAFTYLRVDFHRVPPLTVVEPSDGYPRYNARVEEMTVPESASRFLLASAFFFTVAICARFAFWYWGLLLLGRDQARMIVVDMQWNEDRREMSRQEKWRGWQKGKILGKAREKFGCSGWFLAIGLPLILLFLFLIVLCCSGGFR
jgi:hypothetical protein